MALTSRDETDLLLPLMQTADEDPPFHTFLERLRRRTGVISTSISLRLDERRELVEFFAGPGLTQRANALQLQELNLTNRVQYDRLRLGRVYTSDEFDDHDLVRKALRAKEMRKLGLADGRVVRLLDDPGVSAWLVIASERPCTAADSALLSNLTPYVAATLRSFIAGEKQRLAEALNARTLRHAGCGWIVFDKGARVLALPPATAQALEQATGHTPVLGQRLRELGFGVDRALTEAAAAFAEANIAPEQAIVLTTAPTIQAILSPTPMSNFLDDAAMIATCRHVREPTAKRREHLAQLHAVARREAELAILLADGFSLAEAGETMGLSIETTRNYSKRLYAKMSVRGQAELVSKVYESCALLA